MRIQIDLGIDQRTGEFLNAIGRTALSEFVGEELGVVGSEVHAKSTFSKTILPPQNTVICKRSHPISILAIKALSDLTPFLHYKPPLFRHLQISRHRPVRGVIASIPWFLIRSSRIVMKVTSVEKHAYAPRASTSL